MKLSLLPLAAAAALTLAACTDQTIERVPQPAATPADGDGDETSGDGEAAPDGGEAPPPPPASSGEDAGPNPYACAKSLGSGITNVFGRLDGTVRRVTAPGDKTCRSDDDHVIVQIDTEAGETFAAWVNVQSTLAGVPTVSVATISAPLEGPAWAAGWHPGAAFLDYASTLGVHAGDFEPLSIPDLAARISSVVTPGAKVSAYFEDFGTGDGGHKVHRNGAGNDGALVVLGSGAPTYLLFHFSDQLF
jgi:hypothetical protein